jgi:hypothetical protein
MEDSKTALEQAKIHIGQLLVLCSEHYPDGHPQLDAAERFLQIPSAPLQLIRLANGTYANGSLVMERCDGIGTEWELKEAGHVIDHDFYRYDLAARHKIKLVE